MLKNMSVTNQKCSALVPCNQRVLLYFTFWTFCLTSKDRSFLTAQIQMPMETRDRNMRGMKTRIQEWVSASRLLQARNSNISSSRCIPVQITIALNWTWLLCSILRQNTEVVIGKELQYNVQQVYRLLQAKSVSHSPSS